MKSIHITVVKNLILIFKELTRSLFFSILIIFFLILITSLFSRIFISEKYNNFSVASSLKDCRNSPHYKVSEIQANLLKKSLNDLDEYCKSVAFLNDNPSNSIMTYWDYHYYSHGEMSSDGISFNDISHYNTRKVPCSKEPENTAYRIWIFGGSTMQNSETIDSLTIANTICKKFQDKFGPINLLNMGVGGFVSETEIYKFLNLYKLNIINKTNPNLLIFYDGFNDSERLYINSRWTGAPGDVSNKFAFEVNQNNLLFQKLTYLSINLLDKFSLYISDGKINITSTLMKKLKYYFFSKSESNNELIFKKKDPSFELNNLLLSSQAYIFDQTILSGICNTLKIQCITILQPLLANRDNPIGYIENSNYMAIKNDGKLLNILRFYAEVKDNLYKINNNYYHFVDLSDMLNKPPYNNFPHFYDFGHTGFYTGEIIGDEMAKEILKILNK